MTRTKYVLRPGLLTTLTALFLAGCGGSDNKNTTTRDTEPPQILNQSLSSSEPTFVEFAPANSTSIAQRVLVVGPASKLIVSAIISDNSGLDETTSPEARIYSPGQPFYSTVPLELVPANGTSFGSSTTWHITTPLNLEPGLKTVVIHVRDKSGNTTDASAGTFYYGSITATTVPVIHEPPPFTSGELP